MDSNHLSRRNFLKLGGSAALAMLPVSAPGLAAAAIGTNAKVPVLVPAGATEFVQGLQQAVHGIQWSVQSIKAGWGDVYQQAEALFKAGEKFLVTFLNTDVVSRLHPLLDKYGATLVVATVGENVVRPAEVHPQVFYVSLHYWESNWTVGQWAAANLGKKAFVLSSFYESGYDSLYAFSHGFEANGGEVIATRITHINPQQTNFEAALNAALHADVDLVFAAYEGKLATEFTRAWTVYGNRPLVTSAFMKAPGSTSVRSWLAPVSPLLAAGQDTARLVEQALVASDLNAGLRSASFESARNTNSELVAMNPITQMLASPLYLQHAGQTARVEFASNQTVLADLLEASTVKTGWTSAYEMA